MNIYFISIPSIVSDSTSWNRVFGLDLFIGFQFCWWTNPFGWLSNGMIVVKGEMKMLRIEDDDVMSNRKDPSVIKIPRMLLPFNLNIHPNFKRKWEKNRIQLVELKDNSILNDWKMVCRLHIMCRHWMSKTTHQMYGKRRLNMRWTRT